MHAEKGSPERGYRPSAGRTTSTFGVNMLYSIFLILLILWLLGLVSGNTFGGLVYLLLLAALIVLVIRLVQGPPWWGSRGV